MQSLPASSAQTKLDQERHPGKLLGAVLLSVLISHSALAATDSYVDCDRLASNLRSLDVPAAAFPATDMELNAGADGEELVAVLESENNDSVAPVLLLTPRVATIMRDVFNASMAETDEVAVLDETETEVPALASPPQANAPRTALPDSSIADDRNENNRYVPRYQRQMYRTDI